MRIAILAPIERQSRPPHESRLQQSVSLLAQGLVRRGIDVTLFGSAGAQQSTDLRVVVRHPYGDSQGLDSAAWEALHISELFERALDFDLIHNCLGSIPLTYSGMVETPVLTTIHGWPLAAGLPIYRKYNHRSFYVSVSDSARSPELTYTATIHPGIDLEAFPFQERSQDLLAFIGPIRAETGAREAIEIAQPAGKTLIIAGLSQDEIYFQTQVEPFLDSSEIKYVGALGPHERAELLGKATALLHPITFDEPFSFSAVEANACGTPVIAFARGAMPELITDGQNGFLVKDVTEAVAAVDHLDSLSREECRRIAEERFSAHRMVQDYHQVYARIVEQTRREETRPWGYYEVLSDKLDHKVKRIVVHPDKKISLQLHRRRSEHWTIVSGSPIVTRDTEEIRLNPGDSIEIPVGAKHRVANPGTDPVVFIEVQTGDYFGEDDIERFEDDYGRPLVSNPRTRKGV
jgi:mannose-6-phosphate isomerase-like protein (cupin superfamily)